MNRLLLRWMLLGAVLVPCATPALAQQRKLEQLYTADGIRLEFPADGVWRRRGRRVAAYRQVLRAAGRFDALNAPVIAGAPLAGPVSMSGTLQMPSVLLAFSDADTTTLSKAASYDSLFYTTQPLSGRPYTVRTFYEEVSDGLFSVNGNTYGWVPVDSASGPLVNACGMGKDPIGCTPGRQLLHEALTQALSAIDASVDFSAYDNDGMDDNPNSGDDDGVVDIVQFLQPLVGHECSGTGYGAHRFSLTRLDFSAGAYITDDVANGGGMITVNAYYITSGVGGSSCSNAAQIMPIGTSTHELGHAFDLPDLYDTNPNDSDNSEGIGEWGLMGSGNFTSLNSPAHLSAWSKEQLGWVAVRELTAGGNYSFGPVVTSDTVFMVRPLEQSALARGEYYLLENKQSVGADAANMTSGGNAGPKLGGLVVLHIDSTKIVNNTLPFAALNSVNTGAIHGVAVLQADGLGELDNSTDRGDAGDPFPGTSVNTNISFNTNPALANNSNASSAGFEIGSITQVVPGGAMSFNLTFAPALAATPATPPDPVMGAVYSFTLAATGGTGSYSWAVTSGALPPGLTLAANGNITGPASDTGSFMADVTVTSGAQTDVLSLQFTVTEPQLATGNVLNHILGMASVLSVDELNYLDLVGNQNAGFDVGDFLAWVDRTGATPTASAVASVVSEAASPQAAGESTTDEGVEGEGRLEP